MKLKKGRELNAGILEQNAANTHAAAQPKTPISSVIAASSGNLVEWFDFYIYGFAAVYFAQNFSHASNALFQQIEIFAVFAAGFLMLPVGSLIFGRLADKNGRKNAMIISIIAMGLGSILIAFLPDKHSIGDWAIALLLLARLVQGVAVGGEFGIVATYLTEIAPPNKRGFVSSFQYATIIGAQLLAVASISLMSLFLDEAQMQSFGWRILFLLGGALALVSLIFRAFMKDDSPQMLAKFANRGSLRELVRHIKPLLLVIGVTAGCTIGFYAITTYPKVFMINNGVDKIVANNIMLGSLFLLCLAIPLIGALSDKIGFKSSLFAYLSFCIVGIYPLFLLLKSTSSVAVMFAVCAFMCLMLGFYTAVAAISKTSLFPPHIRALGAGFGCMLSVGLFGGSVNYVALEFKAAGVEWGFFFYFAAVALISLVCVYLIPKERQL